MPALSLGSQQVGVAVAPDENAVLAPAASNATAADTRCSIRGFDLSRCQAITSSGTPTPSSPLLSRHASCRTLQESLSPLNPPHPAVVAAAACLPSPCRACAPHVGIVKIASHPISYLDLSYCESIDGDLFFRVKPCAQTLTTLRLANCKSIEVCLRPPPLLRVALLPSVTTTARRLARSCVLLWLPSHLCCCTAAAVSSRTSRA